MKRATLYTVFALMIGTLTLTGCGTVSANANITNASHNVSNTQSQTTPKPNHSTNIGSQPMKTGGYNLNNSTSQGKCIGSLYSVLGKIAKVNQTQNFIQSIQLTVIKSTTANRIEPLQRGKSYIIYFDQPKSELHSLQLKNGTYIDIIFSQFIRYSDLKKRMIPAHAGWIWGSNYDWVKIPTWEYSVEGRITKVSQSSNVVESIQLDVMKPIDSVVSEWEPLKPGREYTIYFNESKTKLHSLQLIKGTVIEISFGQYVRYLDPKKRTIPVRASWVWGSNFDWVKALGVSISPKTIIEKSYPSSTEATDAITNLEPNNGQFYPSGPAVNLGLGIKAEFSGFAGQYGFKWNEGRWIVLTQFSGNDAKGTKLVKEIVAYLHTHMLPVPESKGVIIIQQTGSSTLKVTQNTIAWQVGNKVYQLQQTDDPIRALQSVVNSNKA